MKLSKPIYLHFLDRELWESTGYPPNSITINNALKTLLLGTDVSLYCSLSLILENPALRSTHDQISPMVVKLIENGAIEPVSQYPSLEEFIETRKELYQHDQSRYPIYFQKQINQILQPHPGQLKKSSATRQLESELYSWTRNQPSIAESIAPPVLLSTVRDALNRRDEKAITYAMFRPYLEKADICSPLIEYEVRRQISKGYTSHYLDYAFGDIPTGILGLSYFDSLNTKFPDYDIQLIDTILRVLGFRTELQMPFGGNERYWESIASKRAFDAFSRISAENVRFILRVIYHYCMDNISKSSKNIELFGVRASVKYELEHRIQKIKLSRHEPDNFFSRFALQTDAARRSIESDKEMRKAVDIVVTQMGVSRPRVLLCTATTIERDTVLRLSEPVAGSSATPQFGSRRAYFRLGEIGGAEVYLVQTEMGSVGPGASLSTIGDAIDDIRPTAVIMVGIAFGVNEQKQNIGEVIVSKQLQLYELARIGTSSEGKIQITLRGDRVTASTQILSRLRLAETGWSGKKVRVGVLLSGEKLIDNIDYRSELEAISNEVEGGEMEGAGLYAAAVDRNVDWIVVKSICDWADGNKNVSKTRRQKLAAEQSTEFVLRALQQGGFAVMNVA